jgi:hypothetical protein
MFGATSDFTIYNDALLASAILVKGGSSNVLINTTDDTGLYKLDVNGSGRFIGTLTTNLTATRIPFIGTGGVLSDDAGLSWDNVNKRLGVGLTNPAVNIEIRGASNSNYLRLSGDDANGARALDFTSFEGGGFNGAGHQINAKSQFGVLSFATNSTERMRITSGGNVGIGTTNPFFRLGIEQNVTGTYSASGSSSTNPFSTGTTLYVWNNANQNQGASFIGLAARNADGDLNHSYIGSITEIGASSSLVFGRRTGTTSYSETWRITSTGIFQSNGAQTIQTSTGNLTLATAGGNGNILLSPNGTGNVGIGTTAPSDRLDIVGNIKLLSGGELRLDGGSWNNYLRIWRRSATDDVQLRWQDNTNLMLLRPNGEVIIQSGNVGIGTTAPSERLHVEGNGYFGATNDSTSGIKKLTVETRGFAGLELLGDTANISGEPGGAYILLAQDGAKLTGGATEVKAMLGIVQSDNNDGAGGTYTGTTSNSVYFGHKLNTGNLHLGAGNAVRLTINSSGRVLIGSPPPTESTFQLDVNGTFRTTQLNLSALNTAPASATATGVLGEIRITATHIYVCTATNTWVRAALTTW